MTCSSTFGAGGGSRRCVCRGRCRLQAAMQDADEAVGELPQRGLVADIAAPQRLVVRGGARVSRATSRTPTGAPRCQVSAARNETVNSTPRSSRNQIRLIPKSNPRLRRLAKRRPQARFRGGSHAGRQNHPSHDA
jgi:hypothetical protein